MHRLQTEPLILFVHADMLFQLGIQKHVPWVSSDHHSLLKVLPQGLA